jgi:hypothetical protein
MIFEKALKRVVLRILNEPEKSIAVYGEYNMKSSVADRYLSNLGDTVMVHKISNGYLLRIEHSDDQNINADPNDVSAMLIYAKDEKDLAEQIIAQYTRMKLAPDSSAQGELFPQVAHLGAGQASVARANRG